MIYVVGCGRCSSIGAELGQMILPVVYTSLGYDVTQRLLLSRTPIACLAAARSAHSNHFGEHCNTTLWATSLLVLAIG